MTRCQSHECSGPSRQALLGHPVVVLQIIPPNSLGFTIQPLLDNSIQLFFHEFVRQRYPLLVGVSSCLNVERVGPDGKPNYPLILGRCIRRHSGLWPTALPSRPKNEWHSPPVDWALQPTISYDTVHLDASTTIGW